MKRRPTRSGAAGASFAGVVVRYLFPSATGDTFDTELAHQPRDTLTSNAQVVLVCELSLDSWSTVRLERSDECRLDQRLQPCVLARAPRAPTFLPRVVAGPSRRRARCTAGRQGAARPPLRPAGISSRPLALPGEENRCLPQDLLLLPKTRILTTQPAQLLTLLAREPVRLALIDIRLLRPAPRRLRCDTELGSDVTKRAAAHTVEPDRLLAKLRRIPRPSHNRLPPPNTSRRPVSGCQHNRVNSRQAIVLRRVGGP